MAIKKLAVIGAGQMGANHARTAYQSDDFDLAYVIDTDLERANKLAATYGAIGKSSYSDLSDLDCVIVATSTSTHYSIVEQMLSDGVPVLCEKPMTMNLEETLALTELSRRNSVPLQCGFVERFNPAFATAKRMIMAEIVHVQAIRHSPPATRIASGVAEDLMIHDLDLALSILESPIVSIAGSTYRLEASGETELAECLIGFQSQAVASLSASRMSQRKIRDWRITTLDNLIEIDLLRQTVAIYENINQEIGLGGGASYRARTTIDYPFIERSGEPLALQLSHFSNLIEGKVDLDHERASIMNSHSALAMFNSALVTR